MKSQIFSVGSVDEAFLACAEHIIKYGRSVSPRGDGTLEIPTSIVEISDPTKSFITLKERKHPYTFMIMELVWMLSGDTNPWITQYLKRWSDFIDDIHGESRLMGAYGPRIRSVFGIDQLRYVVDKLTKDQNSRQAFITISNPAVDHLGYRDTPCTTGFQFFIRDNELEMTATMRSNDLLLGACTDWFNFCSIQGLLASILGVELGAYRHVANSLHVYKRDIEKVERILADRTILIPDIPVIDRSYTSLDQVYDDASYGKNLKLTGQVPNNVRYLSELMRFVHAKNLAKA